MLTYDAFSSVLFLDVSSIIEGLGYKALEVSKNSTKNTTSIRVVCAKEEGEITTDDLEKIYNALYPRLSLEYSRDLELEVSSPGINRNIKDVGEFKVLRNRLVKVYVLSKSSYVSGRIVTSDDTKLTLSGYKVENSGESGDEIEIEYDDISKAKLDYITEAKEEK